MLCPACSSQIPDGSSFCGACGARASEPGDMATTPVPSPSGADMPTTPTGASYLSESSSWPDAQARFLPGTLLEGRYRVVGLLGKGGMGEVYRADDLKLGQTVALKFLPETLNHDADRLGRFMGEVRLARQVTHPNVCRVYDVAEAEGQHYLSMEYIDGEDLSSLLRRIGRLPEDRAVQVARQICAGLAAAHEKGILHRDLKPANIMLDGQGQVRITDFGLAGLADTIGAHEVRAGTPAYMAPEQIRGESVSIQSDLYALGLVLYELFTGKRVFEASNLDELSRLHSESAPSTPTSHVANLDPAVERVILRCLEKDPLERPTSALAVAAGLPGGDPLAAALAAGETPSPELLAAAGVSQALRPGIAFAYAAIALILFIGAARWSGTQNLLNYLMIEKPPAVLVDRACEILAAVGYTEPAYSEPFDTAWGYVLWTQLIASVGEGDSSATRWDAIRRRPDVASFFYRQTPGIFSPTTGNNQTFSSGPVRITDPFQSTTGEATILLDLEGKLRRLEVNPKRYSTADFPTPEADWAQLFDLAGLDISDFERVEARYQRYFTPDQRAAWVGHRPDHPDVELRIEAGSFEGRPILFNLATPAGMESLSQDPIPFRPDRGDVVRQYLSSGILLGCIVLAFFFARRNVLRGRADRRGAFRFSLFFFFLMTAFQVLRSHMLYTPRGIDEIWPILGTSVFYAGVTVMTYLAVEPYGRQVWPRMFVSSSRLLSRPQLSWRDPLIGKSILHGLVIGSALFLLLSPIEKWVLDLIQGFPHQPETYDLDALAGTRATFAWLTWAFVESSTLVIMLILPLVFARYFIRWRPLAIAVAFAVWFLLLGSNAGWDMAGKLIYTLVLMTVVLRLGILTMAAALTAYFLGLYARSPDWTHWTGQTAAGAILVMAALCVVGFVAATHGRSTARS